MPSRREFLGRAALAVLPAMLLTRGRQNGAQVPSRPRPDSGAVADTLPNAVGRASTPLGPLDNDPGVVAIERRLRCTCGCTLDVYTCRTTDFSCTYSPAMHQVVVTQVQQGAKPEQIVQAFVDRYGETVLMAPVARGFNLAGYLVPGLTISALGLALIAWLTRRRGELAPPTSPNGGASSVEAPPDAAQLERLRRALDDVDS
jgi:cytochrome c-type biogenesis protein CcmH/NrfF